ncbi:hypothetical protein EON63_06720, partial [archaeon]
MSGYLTSFEVIRQLNRDRVIEFEQEIKEKLKILENIEKQIEATGLQRKEWLKNISNTFQAESDIHTKMIDVVKAEAELTSLQLKLDMIRLESQYDNQKLTLLVEMTRPLDENESVEDREVLLAIKARSNADVLRAALEQSLDVRLRLMDRSHDLQSALSKVKGQATAELQQQAEDVRRKLETYRTQMRYSAARASELYGTVLRDYLILRHNAHVAERILQQSQNDAAAARQRLRSCLELLLQEAAEQRGRMTQSAAQQLAQQTAELRGLVVRKERELDDLQLSVKKLQQRRHRELRDLQEQAGEFELKYRALQERRRGEVQG